MKQILSSALFVGTLMAKMLMGLFSLMALLFLVVLTVIFSREKGF